MSAGLTKIIDGLTAGANRTSGAVDPGRHFHAAVQLKWADLTGTLNGKFALMVSLNGTDFVAKNDASGDPIEVVAGDAANGEIISLNDVVTEPYYRLDWIHGGCTGGTLDAWLFSRVAKG